MRQLKKGKKKPEMSKVRQMRRSNFVRLSFLLRAILSNQDVLPSTPMTRLLSDDFWGTPLSHSGSHGSYRPLCVLSFRLNYMAGGFRAWGYHLVNILLHCLATGLVVRVARVLFPPGATLPAAVTGLLFAAHPIHTEAVAGVVGRADLLACVFYLLSFLCYVSHVRNRDQSLTHDRRQWLSLAACVLLAATAILSKETGVTVLLVCAAYDVVLHLRYWQGDLRTVFTKVIQALKQLRPRSRHNTWLLHHDNAPAHRVTMDFLARSGLTVLDHPPYSPDLAPCDFAFFPDVKMKLKGRRLASDEEFLAAWDQECENRPPRGVMCSLSVLGVALLILVVLRLCLLGSHAPVFATADNPASRSPSLLTRTLTFAFLPVFNFYLLVFPRWLSFDWSMDSIPRISSLCDPRNLPVFVFYYILYRTVCHATHRQMNPTQYQRTQPQNRRKAHMSTQKVRRHVVYRKTVQQNHQDLTKTKVSTCPVCRHSLLDHHSVLCRTNNNNNVITQGSKCNCNSKMIVRGDKDCAPQTRGLRNTEMLLVSLSFLVVPFLPATNVLFYVGFVVAERVLYIPSVGFCLLVGLGCHVLRGTTRSGTSARRMLHGAVLLLVLVMAARTVRRAADWSDEESLYRAGIPINPPKAYGNLGSVYSSQGRTTEAEWAYRKALEYRSNMADVHYNLGVLLQGSERYDEAVQSFQLAIQYRPTLALAHLNLGQLYERRGQCQEAERLYRICSRLDGSALKDPRTHEAARISALLHLGRLCADQGRLHEAIATYQEAVLTMPDYYPPQVLYNLLGEAYFRFRHYKHAERWFQAALRAEPTHVPAYLLYGTMLARNKSRLWEAERWFQKALDLAPADPGVHHHYGQFLSAQHRHGEAAVHYERAAELAPSELELVVSAATALRRAGLTHRAELFYRRAVLLSPQSARSHLNLGAILHVNGKYEEAVERYQEALRLQPGDVTTLTNLQKLHSLMQRQGTAA
ncbi:protein O-mannosyl-transferase TMTC2 [Anabrus simplex]|uniref:protein O-mannosyl-transferase TMTC2 n=1 Tax=Anabrus simplex TaxID=316456 RepID=UPI0035A3CAD3